MRHRSSKKPQRHISPLLSNIMLHELDERMERHYLDKKVRKDRWAWNFGILKQAANAAVKRVPFVEPVSLIVGIRIGSCAATLLQSCCTEMHVEASTRNMS